jgi:hypothetical protein
MSIERRARAAEKIYLALCAYDDYASVKRVLKEEYKISEETVRLQLEVVRSAYPEFRMSVLKRQMLALRLAGNIDEMKRGCMIPMNAKTFADDTDNVTEAIITDIGERGEDGKRSVLFTGLTGMWAGITLAGARTTMTRIRRGIQGSRFVDPETMASYEVIGNMVTLVVNMRDNTPSPAYMRRSARTKKYNNELKKARRTRHPECEVSCNKCGKRIFAKETDLTDNMCCPLAMNRTQDERGNSGSIERGTEEGGGGSASRLLQSDGPLPEVLDGNADTEHRPE